MNCCNDFGQCTRGHGCPAGETCRHCFGLGYDASGYACACVDQKPAKVAKVGRRYHDRSALRGSAWRRNLKDLARAMLLCLAVVGVSAVTVALMVVKP